MVQQMLAEIQELKEASLQGYVRNYQGNRGPLIMPMEESEAFKGPLGALVGLGGWMCMCRARFVPLPCMLNRTPPTLATTQQATCRCRRA